MLLAVVIMSNSAVEKETVVLDDGAAPDDVAGRGAELPVPYLDGHRLADIPALSYPGRPRRSRRYAVAKQARGAFRRTVEIASPA